MKPRILLITLLTLLFIPLTVYAKNPITWTPKAINKTMGLGATATVDITLTSKEDLGSVELWIVPELNNARYLVLKIIKSQLKTTKRITALHEVSTFTWPQQEVSKRQRGAECQARSNSSPLSRARKA